VSFKFCIDIILLTLCTHTHTCFIVEVILIFQLVSELGTLCFYLEHSDDGEELKEAYKTLYVEFEKLREGRKQYIHDLNSLQTEKSSLLRKIQELEEKLLETQLQLKRVTNEKLTHMLSIQKSPTDKTGLGYVAPPSDTPSTSRTVFVKQAVPEPPPTVEDKGKDKKNVSGHVT